MDWLVLLFVICGTYVVWMLVCLGIFFRFDKGTPESWHRKLYFVTYTAFPVTRKRYALRLHVQPLAEVLLSLGLLTVFAYYLFRVLTSFLLDWLVVPAFMGERVEEWKKIQYWESLFGEYGRGFYFRNTPSRVRFLKFRPWKWMLGTVVAFGASVGLFFMFLELGYGKSVITLLIVLMASLSAVWATTVVRIATTHRYA